MTFDLSFLATVPVIGVAFAHLSQILSVVAALVAAASAIAAVVPHPVRVDGWLATARRVVDWLALNVGHATPAAASTRTSTGAKSGA